MDIIINLRDFLSSDKSILLLNGLGETLFMVFGSMCIGSILGLALGLGLFITGSEGRNKKYGLYSILNGCVNAARSIPYIILTVLFIPLTRLVCGSSIGTCATLIPLSFAAALLVARVIEESLMNVPRSLSDIGASMGASPVSTIRHILLPEALPSIVGHITTITINIVGYSAMAGTVGGGGLGDLAIRYGYQRYDIFFISLIVFVLILLVQVIHFVGSFISYRVRK
jgi:D-methionine transport system permease protein